MSVQLLVRCAWANSDPLYIRYHDEEWGVPVHDDRRLFEMLILEGAQAGLSWITILRKRPAYRRAFDRFDPKKVARFDKRRRRSLMSDPGIVRNRLKIDAAVVNANAFVELQREHGSFDRYIWQFVGGRPIVNRRVTMKDVPATTPESDGSTICYAFMQAVGMVDDHLDACHRKRGGATNPNQPQNPRTGATLRPASSTLIPRRRA